MSLRKQIQNIPLGLERNMTVAFWWLFDQKPNIAIIESKLYDRYHDISLLIKVDLSKQVILEFEIEERRTPFSSCPGAIVNYDFLVGKKLNRPALEIAIREYRPLSQHGCIRIDQLLFYAVDNFVSALGYELKRRHIPERWNEEIHNPNSEEFQKRSAAVHQWWIKDRVMKDSCFTMSGAMSDDIARKDLEAEPSITTLLLGLRKSAKD
ncbi:hypothetical protein LPTSP4_17490 [Leptospira ryugenii]|uniref:DUF2889 domain-containing protein n=1 Tax=Leptospira ryugenii TaxID=1917863 RepID=A0A2P2E018_9LEPT|nr:DUF2889 domain-containing protein [Leptospira ryugenii]GBF50225.1 hypothetical protein LPTSP4_17490 [Leptospira ryugenii]